MGRSAREAYIDKSTIRSQWENAAPGWAKWEESIAKWAEPATQAMLELAAIAPGARVLDTACGAGSQTLSAAQEVGKNGHVVASDISETMLRHVQANARAVGLGNVSTLLGAADELEVPAESFDAVICRLGLMLKTFETDGKFVAPSELLVAAGTKPNA